MTTKSMTCPVCAVAKDFIFIGFSETELARGAVVGKLWYCPTCHVVIVEI